MSRTSSSAPQEWSGDMLDQPEMVQAFAAQLRRVLSDQAAFVAQIRRDAEAMWAENPPEGYGSFEAWWRHGRVTAPFAAIQERLEDAAKLTFRLAARHEKHRHKVPDRRQAAAEAKQQAALGHGSEPVSAPGPPQRRPVAAPAQADTNFMDMIQRDNGRRSA
jgi:hypothetical protein